MKILFLTTLVLPQNINIHFNGNKIYPITQVTVFLQLTISLHLKIKEGIDPQVKGLSIQLSSKAVNFKYFSLPQ